MKKIKPKHILVLTYWSYSDALITKPIRLPYLKIISNILPPKSKIHLVTLEQKAYSTKKRGNKKGGEVTQGIQYILVTIYLLSLRLNSFYQLDLYYMLPS